MIRKIVIPIIAVLGLAMAIFMVIRGRTPVPAAQPVVSPAQAPYPYFVAGAGLIESATEDTAVGTLIPGVVSRVYVQVGDEVKAGAKLFEIDDRDLKAQLTINQAAVAVAQQQLTRLQAMPRPEDLPPLQALVDAAQARVDDLADSLKTWESVSDQRAVSQEEMSRKRFAVTTAKAQLAQAKADLDLAKAGAWDHDIRIAKAQLQAANAQVLATQIQLSRLVVTAPFDCKILQAKIRKGEFAPAGVVSPPLMTVGDVSTYHIRVDVDENDAWRVRPNAPAVAFARGNRDITTPVTFVRFEPLVIPKKSLTGDSTERVDTRVLQVIYAFKKADLPLFIGQQMDLFIEAPPFTSATSKPAKTSP